MSRALNEAMIATVLDFLGTTKDLVFLDYSRLDANSNVALRRTLKQSGVSLLVRRNGLVRRAIAIRSDQELKLELQGAVAIAIGGDDIVALARCIKSAIGDRDTIRVVGGLADGQPIDSHQVVALSESKGRKDILSDIAGLIEGVGSSVVATVRSSGEMVAATCDAVGVSCN